MCAYTVPHPSEKQINVRVQTNRRVTSAQVLQDALETLRAMCEHMRGTFEAAVESAAAKA
jgi:DNA-directed RNA polymerase I and III subunit RPAC2